jgi:acyl carrier protein
MPATEDKLLRELAAKLVEACDVRDVDPATLTRDTPLFGKESPLGLDSLDSLEIVHMLQTDYGVRIDDQNTARQVLTTLGSLCDCVATRTPS